MRVVIIGFDGLDYYRVLSYIDHLPTFRKFKNFIGRLESTIPPSTAPAWVSMFTGKTPAEHGVYGFINIETRQTMNYNDIKSKKLWDYLKNLNFGIINVPMTYPPDRNIKGLIVAGFPTPTYNLKKLVYPPIWIPVLKNLGLPNDIDEMEFKKSYLKNKEEAFNSLLKVMNQRADVYIKLLDSGRFDVFWGVFRETDIVQHLYREEDKIVDIYKKTDEILARFVKKLKDDDWLLIVSDHGHCTVNKVIYVDVLIKRCILHQNDTMSDKIKGRMMKFLKKFPHVEENILKIMRYICRNKELLKSELKNVVYNADSWSLKVSNDQLKDRIFKFLKELKDENEQKVFLKVLKKEELYPNANVNLPDFFFVPNYGYYPISGIKFGEINNIIDFPKDPSHNGTHTLNGLCVVYNKFSETIKNLSINKVSDIVPTVLKIFKANDRDG